jgi:hypothetical protein
MNIKRFKNLVCRSIRETQRSLYSCENFQNFYAIILLKRLRRPAVLERMSARLEAFPTGEKYRKLFRLRRFTAAQFLQRAA